MTKRFVVCGDSHGDMIDPVMEAALFSWLADFKPEIVMHAGDLFDFGAIRMGAGLKEQGESMKADYDAGMSFAKRLFAFGKERHFLRGNHDERMWDIVANGDGPLRDYAEEQVAAITNHLRALKVKMLP